MERTERAHRVYRILRQTYPDAHCELRFRTPLELLVATVLSAQCTDARVNQVTPTLFAAYPDAHSLAEADRAELERIIRPTGFFRRKAANLRSIAVVLVRDWGGTVPADLDTLTALPGVGRKTANVVRGNAFGLPGITVDTHVGRLSRRLGFTREQDPTRVETDLAAIFPESDWTPLCHTLIQHGRQVCRSRRPACDACPVADLCPSAGEEH
jgi:endonuclease-3